MTEVTGGELLTLWKVGQVELPRIAQVYLDAIGGLTAAREAAAAFFREPAAAAAEPVAGQAGPAWQRVCDELTETLSLCARNTLAATDAVGRAIGEHTRTDADGTGSLTEAGQELWRRIHDPNEIDPADPDQNPPRHPDTAAQADDHALATEGPGRRPAESGYLSEVTPAAESIKRLVIDKQKADEKAFEDFVKARFQRYARDLEVSWKEWERAYTEWRTEQHAHEPAVTSGPPARPAATQGPALIAVVRAEYEKQLEVSYDWIVSAFQAWAAHDPDALTPGITAVKAAEDRLGDGQAVRFANSAEINLASQWDGSYCTSLRNFLASFLIMPGNQQTIRPWSPCGSDRPWRRRQARSRHLSRPSSPPKPARSPLTCIPSNPRCQPQR